MVLSPSVSSRRFRCTASLRKAQSNCGTMAECSLRQTAPSKPRSSSDFPRTQERGYLTPSKRNKTLKSFSLALCSVNRNCCTSHACCLGVQVLVGQLVKDGLCRQHAALHCRVRSFDLGDVHEAWAAANQSTARERQLGYRL